jgi:hypothetical protein
MVTTSFGGAVKKPRARLNFIIVGKECTQVRSTESRSMKESSKGTKPESQVSPYLMNLRRYGGRDEELEEARKQILKRRKKQSKVQEKDRSRAED